MNWKSSVAAPLLLMMLFLTSCVAAAPVPAANNAKRARYVAELEPPSQYSHPYYDGPVEERVLPVAEVRVLVTHLVPRIRVRTHQLPGAPQLAPG